MKRAFIKLGEICGKAGAAGTVRGAEWCDSWREIFRSLNAGRDVAVRCPCRRRFVFGGCHTMMQPFQGCDLRGAIPRVALFESRNPGLDDSIPLGLWEMGDAITAKLCEQDDSIALWLCERDGSITAGFCERLFAADWFGISGKLSRGVRFLFLFLLASFASASVSLAQDKNLGVEFAADFKGAPLFFDTLSNMNAAGRRRSVTRLDFWASDFAVRRAGG